MTTWVTTPSLTQNPLSDNFDLQQLELYEWEVDSEPELKYPVAAGLKKRLSFYFMARPYAINEGFGFC